MTTNRIRDYSSTINLCENVEMAIDKARAILDFMLSANLKEHSVYNIHLALGVVDDFLEDALFFKQQLR